MHEIHHLIDGQHVVGVSGRTSPVFNPATGGQTGQLSLASAEEVDAAVASAKAAFEEWRQSLGCPAHHPHVRLPKLGG